MSKYNLTVVAKREVVKANDYGYSGTRIDKVSVTRAELFEAISKYLQVKGFDTEQLVIETQSDDSTKGV